MRALAGAALLIGALAFGPPHVDETGWGFLVGFMAAFGVLFCVSALWGGDE